MARKTVAATAALLLIGAVVSACGGRPSASGDIVKNASQATCTTTRVLEAIQPDPNDPSPRHSSAMAYDAVRKQVVMFGGKGANGSLADTWVWNGSSWLRQYPTNSPPPRALAAMTFDARHGVVVLFGGSPQMGPLLDDTWTWDGSDWTQQHPAARPPADSETPMDYDAALGQVVLLERPFLAGPVLGAQTWAWDGANWHQLHPAGSPRKEGAAMAYDPATQTMVLFAQGQTWTFDGTAWKEVAAHGPTQSLFPNMAYDSATRSVVLFNGGGPGATWTWDGASWTQSCPVATPPPLTLPAMSYDGAAHSMVVFGGSAKNLFSNATWTWDGTTWSQWHVKPAAATPSPVVAGMPPGWNGYVSPHWRYSVAYPPTWYDLPNYGVPDTQKYFSNQNVGAPLEMESGGVWLTISVNLHPDSPCGGKYSLSGPGVVDVPITIDGEATTQNISPNGMTVAVTHKTWCYEFSVITYSHKTLDQNMNDVNAILASFRFNQ